ncbi:MAG: uracil phosphoribosyltransferase [Ignavibacteria bacterium]|nr:uracil phosphoribosyltransferase [Ignavibacteria bacterium]
MLKKYSAYKNLIQLAHPLVKSYITKIRDKNTSYLEFRQYVDKLSMLLAYEAGKEVGLKSCNIKTPLASYRGSVIKDEIVLMPILRAGLGLLNGFTSIFPEARISHLGVYRNESTLQPIRYYFKFPVLKNKKNTIVYILDPMLATGGSMCSAIDETKKTGVLKIVAACLVAAPEGIKEVQKYHSDIKIFTCAVDKKLNNKGYIMPGLGDAGDRLFGTI